MGFCWRRGKRARACELTACFLSEWHPGTEGVIAEVAGSSRLANRLRELGVIPGERIRVLRAGCPLVVQVGGGRFCMRKRDATRIRVHPGPRAGQAV